MRYPILVILVLLMVLPAAARTQKLVTYEVSANGDRSAELVLRTDQGSLIAGCRTSTQSENYQVYMVKSDHRGNQVCIKNSRRDEVVQKQYVQQRADGSSLVVSCESAPNCPDQACIIVQDPAGRRMMLANAEHDPWLKQMWVLGHEMTIYLNILQRGMHEVNQPGHNHPL
ncbi:MAG: hypothetical protein C4531_08925 [Desulfurivibrio sp.]|nr:MAG: hypothetical protein C4531_08925 [Desulfurivibrio sp.]